MSPLFLGFSGSANRTVTLSSSVPAPVCRSPEIMIVPLSWGLDHPPSLGALSATMYSDCFPKQHLVWAYRLTPRPFPPLMLCLGFVFPLFTFDYYRVPHVHGIRKPRKNEICGMLARVTRQYGLSNVPAYSDLSVRPEQSNLSQIRPRSLWVRLTM